MPSQFQLRDLINHLLVGAVALLLAALFCCLLFPVTWERFAANWTALQEKLGAGLLIPTALVVAYTVGAAIPSSGLLFDDAEPLLQKTLSVLRIIKPYDYIEISKFDSALPQMFSTETKRLFGLEGREVSDDDLFRLATAHVLSAPTSLQQLDIERHFILKHYNAKLCVFFLAASLLSLVGFLKSTVLALDGVALSDTRILPFFLLVLVFYTTARASGRKAQRNHAHWRALIMRSVLVSALHPQPAPAQR